MGDFQNLFPLPRGVSEEDDELMDTYERIYWKHARRVYEETVMGGCVAKNLVKKEEEQYPSPAKKVRTSQGDLKNQLKSGAVGVSPVKGDRKSTMRDSQNSVKPKKKKKDDMG